MISKKAVLRLSGILFLLAICFLIVIFTASIEAPEPKPETWTARSGAWTESCENDLQGKITCTRTLYSGQMNYYNGTEFTEIDTTIRDNPSEEPLYDYGVQTGAYHAFFKTDPSTAASVKYYYNQTFMKGKNPHKAGFSTFQPHSLNYRNALDQLQQINTIQAVDGLAFANNFSYENAFDYSVDLDYEYWQETLKKTLVVNDLNQLPSLEGYMYGAANITLDLDFLITWKDDLDIFIGSSQWDSKNDLKTKSRIDFRLDGETLFYLPKPYAYDSNGSFAEAGYTLKKSGSSLYVVVSTPYEWLNSTERVYPVYIDPSVTLQDADTENLGDAWVNDATSSINRNYGVDTTLSYDSPHTIYFTFALPNADITAPSGNLSVYRRNPAGGEGDAWITAHHVYVHNMSEGSGDGLDVTGQGYETNVSWVNQPCSTLMNKTSNCNATIESRCFSDGDATPYENLNFSITNMLQQEANDGDRNITIALTNTTITGVLTASIVSKEFTTDITKRPKLILTFSYLDTIAPDVKFIDATPANNSNQTSTTVYLNATVWDFNSTISSCWLRWNSVNYTMTKVDNPSGTKNATCNYTMSSISDGDYLYSIIGNDTAENENTTLIRTITIDTIAPSTKYTGLTAGNNTEIDHDYVLINISAVDATTGTANLTFRLINITTGGQFVVNTTYVYYFTATKMLNFTSLPQGYTYLYNVTSTDYLGNKNTTLRRSITLTGGVPVLTYVTPTPEDNEKTGTSSVTINMTVSAGANVNNCNLTWQGVNYTMTKIGAGTDVTCNYTMNGLEGTYTFKTAAEDTSGNQGTQGERTITADATSPRITITSPPVGSSIQFAATPYNLSINANWTEPLQSTCWYSLNWSGGYIAQNRTFSCGSNTSVSLTRSTLTSYVLIVYSNDTTGNENYAERTFTAKIKDSGSSSSGSTTGPVTIIGKGQPIICQSENLTWNINPSSYTLLLLPDGKARVPFEFSSNSQIMINLSCDDISGNLSVNVCKLVTIEPMQINLTGNILKSEFVYVTLDLEGTSYGYGDRIFFNINANDGAECILPVAVEARISWLAFFLSPSVWLEKLKASYTWDLSRYNEDASPIKIPVWSILFVSILLIGLSASFVFRNNDFKALYSTLTGIVAGIILFFIIPYPG